MQIPNFPECDHRLVGSLSHYSDYGLITQFQQQPDSGRYFTAIFCRYSPVVYSLVRHSARSPVQSDYLFALTWRHILHELSGIELPETPPEQDSAARPWFQSWLINLTAACINQSLLPEVESIHYSITQASPPLWCYVSQALDQLAPLHRLIVLMAQTFHWSETRIAAYLQAEGDAIAPHQVRSQLKLAYQALEAALPDDIRAIYLDYEWADAAAETGLGLGSELNDLLEADFDLSSLPQRQPT
ncbi:sigma-70 family RNA polymerase sigma factor [Romeria aff. gracilis LEGE 07310]|uniref:Sigma-70 family RNA polymerase sigma factor n=1 Tax=Vasconcelosia minhoensis LEGE 07310 TaxID=915328 RepID=A0A8J7AHN9_9CYAN|nr:sigma-70 family RNA polymerase sigma factor [Romeria gracilis]MBE9077743.1 sigma-70 family RNA polymerase sigma factor [Romeria aff. gracilis LEGE 07310]